MSKVPVLIVGAGPVGLALAGDLAWRGVASMIVERTDGAIEQPKMDMVGVRTMEYARRWGIVENVENGGYNRDWGQDNVYVTSLTGYELGRERFPSSREAKPPLQSPQRRERCPQDKFDPVLRTWVRTFPQVDLRYLHELVAFTHDADGVVAEIYDEGGRETLQVEASYIVGCDGASSTVARLLGTKYTGQSVLTNTTNVIFKSAELKHLHDKGEAYRFIVVGPKGTWATLVAIDGWDRYRMSIVKSPREGLNREQVENVIRRVAGIDFPFEVQSIVNWTRRELVAESYGAGRIFIAGDAAHVMSPTGGFGMNTGIGDAVDLSWKLDAVLQGWGGPGLLEAYTLERRPVAERNAKESSGNLARMLSPGMMPLLLDDSRDGAAFRKQFGAEFSETMRREWYTLGIHLGYRYDDSPICAYDGTPAPPLEVARYEQTSRPGARAPHVRMSGGRSTLDLFGRGFVLLQFDPVLDATALEEGAKEYAVPLQVVKIDEPEIRTAYERNFVLVRPDGHVAWRGDKIPADAKALVATTSGRSPAYRAHQMQTR
ncbi:MAG TPA: FAD-dependent oxidoreductase [Candidatus Binatia bacterium]|nr:FAD-dependent oxidoreductase [Candidatus Binatia bacterium]